ncbi:cation:proton antiporter [Actinocrispum sp. NPDC049592]|uniref:cation:proton antiporter n=1 Tax=Actinocrispum sp. NPDC049592 TaxID=3154835 RepID=UPI00343D939C
MSAADLQEHIPAVMRRWFASASVRGSALLTVTLAGVLVSGAVTEWIGLHFLFGAFLFGALLPRDGTERLREEILGRVSEFNTTLLLPVFFIVAGLKVDLSTIGTTGIGELALVLLVAVAGKFGGAFAGARLHRLPARESAALATLMNTRGLTELIILSVGLQLGVLDQQLYSIDHGRHGGRHHRDGRTVAAPVLPTENGRTRSGQSSRIHCASSLIQPLRQRRRQGPQ